MLALDGQPGIHDPSTVVMHGGKFYSYGTGDGLPILVSDDGWTWRRAGHLDAGAARRQAGPGRHRAWRQQHLGARRDSRSATSTSSTIPRRARSPSPRSACSSARRWIPSRPDYKWEDGGPVVWSDGVEDSNAIDPGVFRDPTNGSLWLTYGSYFGYIRLVELNPKTGKRLYPERKPVEHRDQLAKRRS